MSTFSHKHTTRLKTGVLKRKYLREDYSDASCNDSSSGSDIESDDESSSEPDDMENNEHVENKILAKDKLQYYQFLNKLFPSNYSKSKINKIKRQRLQTLPKTKKNLSKKSNKSILSYNDSSENDNEEEEEEEVEHDPNSLLKYEGFKKLFENDNNSNKNINIILNMKDGKNNIFNYEQPSSRNDLQLYYEDEEKEENDEDYDEDDDDDDNLIKKKNKKKGYTDTMEDNEDNTIVPPPKNVSTKNYRKFSKILTEEDKESEYFKKQMSIKDQETAIEKLTVIKNLTSIETPYLIHLINIDIPDIYKACALRKINMLREMGGGFGNSEYYKIKSWVDAFIKIPFNKYNNLPITFADGIEKCHSFMQDAKNTLDSVVFGLDDAKIQIMQLIGLWLVNPNAVGSAIAIKGPMGTGKTTLIKDGISKILNRPFALVALGGCGDSGFLDGHDYTYEGSKYGKIIDILIQSGCMNPIILFDELDKISDTPKGEEIAGVLTHLTDVTQNSHFADKYMSEISLDMSKALYIFSYNDESRVNPILKDRMYKIETKGYKVKEKLVICKDYLLPKIYEQAKFKKEDITFTDDILEYIIKDFTENESGVRNLKRCLEIIYTKLNLYRLMKPEENLFETSLKIDKKVVFPFELKQEIVDKLLNRTDKNDVPFGMYN
jgi:ATP-dependent Lon protease|tara:strand:+ start:416 stop:2404 length:1989 start_codon:yes stop_codon:yes gene_type:complete